MIQIEQLKKIYGSSLVLDIDSLAIHNGEVLGIVGNNGTGKTTLLSLILDLTRASAGEVRVNDIPVSKSEDWKKFVSAYIDESFVIGYLTPMEYFNFIGELRGMNQQDVQESLQGFADFFNKEILEKRKLIRNLSKGNQKKVGVAASFLGNPEIIILDEPFANLDPSSQYILRDLIKQLSSDPNRTILISSHDLDHVAEVCNRIIVLDKGKIVRDVPKSKSTLSELEQFFTRKRSNQPLASEVTHSTSPVPG